MGIGYQKTIDNVEQSQYEEFIQYFLMTEEKTDIILTSVANVGDQIVNVSANHEIQVADYITFFENSKFKQCLVIDVTLNAITLCIPLPVNFTTSCKIVKGKINQAVDGSASPVSFLFKTYNFQERLDICGMVISMIHPAAPDDGKFGDQTELTNPFYIEKVDGVRRILGHYKNNADFRTIGGVIEYPSKSPAGVYSTVIMIDFKKAYTKELRVNTMIDFIRSVVSDDLSGLTSMIVSILGSYTSGE